MSQTLKPEVKPTLIFLQTGFLSWSSKFCVSLSCPIVRLGQVWEHALEQHVAASIDSHLHNDCFLYMVSFPQTQTSHVCIRFGTPVMDGEIEGRKVSDPSHFHGTQFGTCAQRSNLDKTTITQHKTDERELLVCLHTLMSQNIMTTDR